MKLCENCSKEHDGKYGSGRFCSTKCSRGFSTKEKRSLINNAVRLKLTGTGKPNVEKTCENCGNNFSIKYRKRSQKSCSRKCGLKGWTVNHENVNWSEVNKKSYKDGNNYVAGGTTKWITYKNIKVQGSYEHKACHILDVMKDNNEILSWEYSKIRIPYKGEDGKDHTYLVDFLIHTKEEDYLIEVKGRETPNDYLKWEAAKNNGWKLIVWRKHDLFEKRSRVRIPPFLQSY